MNKMNDCPHRVKEQPYMWSDGREVKTELDGCEWLIANNAPIWACCQEGSHTQCHNYKMIQEMIEASKGVKND